MSLQNQTLLSSIKPGTKILFANVPADGHFNPLTGLAYHLKKQGHDVRWYTSEHYRPKVERLGIPFYPLQKALDIAADPTTLFPEREALKSQIAKLNFDIVNVFIKRGPEYYEDIQSIRQTFAFDLMIADLTFTAIPFVTDIMKIPVVAVGIVPITKNSRDLPPAGLGMTPSYSFFGRLKQGILRWTALNVLFAKSNKIMQQVLGEYGIHTEAESVFDLAVEKANLVLQTGSPGFEYKRSDLDPKYKFVGALLPHSPKKTTARWTSEKLSLYKKVVLVTQGTVEGDVNKLMAPTLEAFKDTDVLVIATTGGNGTEDLRKRFTSDNFIIEDFIPFDEVMPLADVYITNGGMGGVMLGIQHNLPMVVAGVHEGKNEITARIGYFNLGINLKTEKPKAAQIRAAVEEVLKNPSYRKNVKKLSKEMASYKPAELCEQYIAQLLPSRRRRVLEEREPEPIY
ncbi:MAG TPA: nucleotide disphospho-sugar-binding domain-containing protein [Flavisolibacter sp.]|nr:nucleotide disphospho-sugar-binding domain-containing protein [Flavisolibacter sp.]